MLCYFINVVGFMSKNYFSVLLCHEHKLALRNNSLLIFAALIAFDHCVFLELTSDDNYQNSFFDRSVWL